MVNLTVLAGTALGGLIGFVLSTLIADRNARIAAGSKFRAIFAPELAIMRATPSSERSPWKDILRHSHNRLATVTWL